MAVEEVFRVTGMELARLRLRVDTDIRERTFLTVVIPGYGEAISYEANHFTVPVNGNGKVIAALKRLGAKIEFFPAYVNLEWMDIYVRYLEPSCEKLLASKVL